MKKFIVVSICALLAMSLAACGSDKEIEVLGTENAQIPNPFVDLQSTDEAKELTGFDLVVDESLMEGFSLEAVRVMNDEMIELIYTSGEDEIRIRKAKGSDDISGDYNEYSETDTVQIGGIEVVKKRNGEKINVAVWSDGGYSYSLTASGEGIDSALADDIINSIR